MWVLVLMLAVPLVGVLTLAVPSMSRWVVRVLLVGARLSAVVLIPVLVGV
ncbi:hypothetical protein [Mycobacteroides abscessus]|uniref:Putative membrane protein n=1 Tax=Mycobacteroides abscessus 21 TaxID=1299324 RepID=A0A829Q6R2_9MYCO|nr:hypothetical protein [Mycobacteroides abscessus]EUA48630.1 putative membrane protein [Mycobacteroides abscessus 21]SKU97179.1 Uncharacterised protein [Mycobacteroides abscessus subsp. abscessus]